jgi:hypothetical protein
MQTFKQIIRKNRELLKKKFPASTIHCWEYGKRHPRFKTAKKLSKLLGIPLNKIPYISFEINR